jgi:hypothetical protein
MSEDEPTTWDLGDDYFCDSCGSTWNELEFDPEGGNGWTAAVRVGCYGGRQVWQDSTEGDKYTFYLLLQTFEHWSQTEMKELRDLITKAETKGEHND